jgi:hypothetical protein
MTRKTARLYLREGQVHLLFSAATSASGKMNEDVIALIEARVTDSVSGQMRAAAIVTLEGKQLQGKKDQLQLQDLQQALDVAASDSAETLHNAMANY